MSINNKNELFHIYFKSRINEPIIKLKDIIIIINVRSDNFLINAKTLFIVGSG